MWSNAAVHLRYETDKGDQMKYHVYQKHMSVCVPQEFHTFLAGPDQPCQCGKFKDLWATPVIKLTKESDRVSMRNMSRPQSAPGEIGPGGTPSGTDHSSRERKARDTDRK